MLMSWIFTGMLLISIICAAITGNGNALSSAAMDGAQNAVSLCIAMSGSICLWSGVGKLMEKCGLNDHLSQLLSPLIHRLFPSAANDPRISGCISANITANLLGLGNAATPMGINAARLLRDPHRPDMATDELCRLIVLNTASIQLLPTNVAAVRSALGCISPFDILPAVWLTSLLSASLGLCAAFLFGRISR